MHGRREYKGPWWVPGDESSQRPGTLTIDEGKVVLEVLGDFGNLLISETPQEKSYAMDLEDQARLIGVSTDGSSITLEQLQEVGQDGQLFGPRNARYRAAVALVGKLFAAGEEAVFDEIAISASDLNSWTEKLGFTTSLKTEPLDDEDHRALIGSEVRYEAPADIPIPLARGEEVFIRFTCQGSGLLGGRSDRIEMRQDAELHWRFARPVDLQGIFERVGQIRNFLSLAVGRPVSVTSVVGFQDSHTHGDTDFPRPIEIHWQIPHNPEPPEDRLHPREMLFTLAEADPDPSTLIKRWISRQDRLEPVFNLYFGTLYHPSLYLEVRFLAFAQALETFDIRRRRDRRRRTLATRTRDVLAQCAKVSRRIVGPDIDAFVVNFKDARNYYTHYDPDLEDRAPRGAALFLLTFQLQTVLEMSLLRQLGFPCRTIEGILERGRRFAKIEHFRRQVEQDAESVRAELGPMPRIDR